MELKSIIDLDQIVSNPHFLIKQSAAQEDYKLVEHSTEVTVWYIKKHVESRSLSIDCSLVRIQLSNLHVYFLQKLQKEKCFNGKNSLANNERYTRICIMLKKKRCKFVCHLLFSLHRILVASYSDISIYSSPNLFNVL